jgi:hypothetical protein
MFSKSGFVIVATALAMFAMGRVESLAAHRGLAGPTAWAQQWDDPADDTAADSQPPTPPTISGTYSGTLDDHRTGPGTLSATISQTGAKVSGTWSSNLGSGTLKGRVRSNDDVLIKLSATGGHGCKIFVLGTFENGDEISGVYHTSDCGKPDHGTFEMTD